MDLNDSAGIDELTSLPSLPVPVTEATPHAMSPQELSTKAASKLKIEVGGSSQEKLSNPDTPRTPGTPLPSALKSPANRPSQSTSDMNLGASKIKRVSFSPDIQTEATEAPRSFGSLSESALQIDTPHQWDFTMPTPNTTKSPRLGHQRQRSTFTPSLTTPPESGYAMDGFPSAIQPSTQPSTPSACQVPIPDQRIGTLPPVVTGYGPPSRYGAPGPTIVATPANTRELSLTNLNMTSSATAAAATTADSPDAEAFTSAYAHQRSNEFEQCLGSFSPYVLDPFVERDASPIGQPRVPINVSMQEMAYPLPPYAKKQPVGGPGSSAPSILPGLPCGDPDLSIPAPPLVNVPQPSANRARLDTREEAQRIIDDAQKIRILVELLETARVKFFESNSQDDHDTWQEANHALEQAVNKNARMEEERRMSMPPGERPVPTDEVKPYVKKRLFSIIKEATAHAVKRSGTFGEDFKNIRMWVVDIMKAEGVIRGSGEEGKEGERKEVDDKERVDKGT
ncbi:hypothetical protein P280DRAFT_519178 [Massarina eburnea CBS 473.64]|uniref:Uncharacterized protein n=1 Tax=Massarina eburnea CBS 473.64 TaxID=1395130 RepID=A0A6A6RW47_9PLEO|nr:hypothetical protein P280DRAFT_519178 [Massarina eburnea CBS 473.64]